MKTTPHQIAAVTSRCRSIRYFLTASLILIATSQIWAQGSYYWVGGSGQWTEYATHWATSSGGSTFHTRIPQSNENVFFDGNSFTSPGQSITLNVDGAANNLDWSGVTNNPIVTGTGLMYISGSLTFSPNMDVSTYYGALFFASGAPGQTITTAGLTLPGLVFNGTGGWIFQDDVTLRSSITLQSGSLNTNNKNITAQSFESSSSSPHSLTLGSSTINLSYYYGFWNTSSYNFTFDAGTSTINGPLTVPSYGNPSFNGGDLTYNNVNLGSNCLIYGGNTFNTLTLASGSTYQFQSGATQTVNSSLSLSGTCTAFATLHSSTQGSAATISKSSGTVSVDFAKLRDIQATGGASFIATNVVDEGNNSGWSISPLLGRTLHWVGGSGNWSDGSHWSMSSGGPGIGCLPTSLDNVIFDSNSFTSSGQTLNVDVDGAAINLDWSGVTNNPIVTGTGLMYISGSLTFSPNMDVSTYYGALFFTSGAPGQTITTAGLTLPGLVFNGTGGWIFQDDVTLRSSITLQSGSLNTNNKNITAQSFESSSSSPHSLTLGSSTINLSYYYGFWNTSSYNFTFDAGTSTINGPLTVPSYGNPSFNGGDLTYNNVNLGSNCLIYGGNTFNTLTLASGSSYQFQSGSIQTVNSMSGVLGNGSFPVDLKSSATGMFATISMASGSVCTDYVRVQDIHVTGGAAFVAGDNSQDLGNNDGWYFSTSSPDPTVDFSKSSTYIAPGDSVTFTATFTNGGTSQNYDWRLNGISVQNGPNKKFISTTIHNNDQIYCVFTSHYGTCSSKTVNTPVMTLTTVPGRSITSFTPTSGDVGSSVTITGVNLDPVSSNNMVRFNGTLAEVTASTTESITVTVPALATSGLIHITINGQTINSAISFTVNGCVETRWYADSDGDGLGNPAIFQDACSQPVGYVENDNDCDDTIHSGRPPMWYIDADGDGFGNPCMSLTQCQQPAGYVDNQLDCDDSNNAIFPRTWYIDNDGDGLGYDAGPVYNSIVYVTGDSCGATQQTKRPQYFNIQSCDVPDPVKFGTYVLNNLDCNDGDATIDSNTLVYVDADGDGYGDPTTGIKISMMMPAAAPGKGDAAAGGGAAPAKDKEPAAAPNDQPAQPAPPAHGGGPTYCTLPAGYVFNNQDCADNDPTVFGDACSGPPTIAASSIQFSNVLSTSFHIAFTRGDGMRHMIVLHEATAVSWAPTDGIEYPANANFPGATDQSNGNRVVYADSSNQVDISGLKPLTTYFAKVYEYNGTGTFTKYLITTPPAASKKTLAVPNVYVSTPGNNAVNQKIALVVTATNLAGATTYTIELNTTSDFSATSLTASGARTQNFNLEYNTKYYARVKTNLSPDYGKVTSFTTINPISYAYVTSPADNATNQKTTLNVTSNTVPGATQYTIQLSTTSTFATDTITKVGAKTQSFAGLMYGTTYYSRVKTELSPQWGVVRRFTTITAESLAYMTSPANLATGVSINPSVTSNTVPGATTYTIELSTSDEFTSPIVRSGAKTLSFSGLLTYNTKYFTRVKTDLSTSYGPVRYFTTIAPTTYVTSPANNAVNQLWKLNITAMAVTGATEYTIQVSPDNTFTTSVISNFGSSKTIAFNDLEYNTTYYTRASTNLSPGLWGAVRNFKTADPSHFSYLTSPKDTATNVNWIVNLTSFTVPDATAYTIEVNTQADFNGASIAKPGGKTIAFILQQSTTYYARVKTDLSTSWGPTQSFSTGNAVSLAYVTSPKNGGTGVPTDVTVYANSLTGATNYAIELNTSPDFDGITFLKTGTKKNLNFTGLSPSTTYYTRVKTNLAPEWGSTVTSFTTANPAARGTADWRGDESDEEVLLDPFSVSVYGNPFREKLKFMIESRDQLEATLTLYDLTGRAVHESVVKTNVVVEIERPMAEGMYLFRVQSGQENKVIRVLKID